MNWVTLNDIAAKKKNAIVDGPFGSSMKTSDYVETGVPVLQGKNITNNKFKWFDVRYISEEKAQELIRSKVEVGDVLMVKIGSIGYVAEIDDLNGYPFAIIPANLAKITLDKSKVNSTYFRYYFQNEKVKGKLLSLASKTAQPALSLSKIKEFKIPLPDLKTQLEIAHVLGQADKARQHRKAANALSDQFLQSSFLSLFGDPVKNEKGWETKKLKEYTERIVVGHVGPTSGGYTDKGIPFLRTQNVRELFINYNELNCITPDFHKKLKKSVLHSGDVLISRVGVNRGMAAVLPGDLDGANCANIIVVGKSHKINSYYLAFYLNFTQGKAADFGYSVGSAQGVINTSIVKEWVIMDVPFSLQQQFAGMVARAEQLRQKQRDSEKQLENLFQGLLQRYFG